MKFPTKVIILFMVAAFMLQGCTAIGDFPQSTGTQAGLYGNNYEIEETNVVGNSHGFTLLQILPLLAPTHHAAKQDLYRTYEGSIEGEPVALVNTTEDVIVRNFLLFSLTEIRVSADVVRFNDAPVVRQQ